MEILIRLSAFLSVFSLMALWERERPRRFLAQPRRERWVTNLGLTTLNTVLVWATVGSVAYAVAVFAATQQVGVLHWMQIAAVGSGDGHAVGTRLHPVSATCDVPCRPYPLATPSRSSCRCRI